jgi:hypothetical protein
MYVGMRVEIFGLNSRPELNGKIGRAVSFESKRGRYAVELQSGGEKLALKAANLSLAADDPDDEASAQNDGMELLECARYGEDDELNQLLAKGVPADFADEQDNTALHRASANGHLSSVKLLVSAGCPHTANASGNTPLHWAVQQGHVEVTKELLKSFPQADVLAQNAFGKSVSSEAFARADAALVDAVLSHNSAAKLEEEANAEEVDDEGDEAEATDGGASADRRKRLEGEVTHSFRLGSSSAPLVRVRELGELGGETDPGLVTRVLGKTADSDRTGLQLWAASIVMSRWLVDLEPQLAGRGLIELGAGCGLCGIVAAKVCQASPVIITDLAAITMDNLDHNIKLNNLSPPHVHTLTLDWRMRETWPQPQPVVIGADLVYALEAVPPLIATVCGLVAPGGAFLYVCPETNRQGEHEFLTRLCASGFECQQSEVPPSYLANAFPTEDGDGEGEERSEADFFLLFSELRQRTYTLYCFTRIGDLAPPPLPVAAASDSHSAGGGPPPQGQATDAVELAISTSSEGGQVALDIQPRRNTAS